MSIREAVMNALYDAIHRAVVYLPPDVKQAIRRAYEEEDNPAARAQLEAILRNIELAEKTGKPLCQDTGLLTLYVELGKRFPLPDGFHEIVAEAARKATREIPLRPNSVHPFTGRNTGDNTGRLVPYIDWEINDGDELKITVVPKGGGAEAVSMLRLPPPGKGVENVVETVIDAVLEAGAKPCAPLIIGVGVGGGADIAMILAKKAAALRRIGERSPDPSIAGLEEKLLEAVNSLGIGVMGLGGSHMVLDVHIEYAHRHPANYPVAVAFQCWAARRATAIVSSSGEYRVYQ